VPLLALPASCIDQDRGESPLRPRARLSGLRHL
jgi:hypothetical protein